MPAAILMGLLARMLLDIKMSQVILTDFQYGCSIEVKNVSHHDISFKFEGSIRNNLLVHHGDR
jgi:hypothetical protein